MPIYYEILGSLVRYAMVALTAYMIQHHVITAPQGEKLTTDVMNHLMIAMPGIMAVVWVVWTKIRTRIRYNTALWEAGISDFEVREKIKAGDGIKAMATLLVLITLVAGLPLMAGCASSGTPTPVSAVADAATKIQLSANAVLHAAMSANATILATGQPLITQRQLDDVAIAVDTVGRAGNLLSTGLRDYETAKAAGGNLDAERALVLKALADIQAAMNSVGRSIPNGTLKALDDAVVSVFSVIAQLKASQSL